MEDLVQYVDGASSFGTMLKVFLPLALVCYLGGGLLSKGSWERVDRFYYVVALCGALLALWYAEPIRKQAVHASLEALSSDVIKNMTPPDPKSKYSLSELESAIADFFEPLHRELIEACEENVDGSCEILDDLFREEVSREGQSDWNYARSDVLNGVYFELLHQEGQRKYHNACSGYWEIMEIYQNPVNRQAWDNNHDEIKELQVFQRTRRTQGSHEWGDNWGYEHGFKFCETFFSDFIEYSFPGKLVENVLRAVSEINPTDGGNLQSATRVSYSRYLALLEVLGWYFFLTLLCLKIGKASAGTCAERANKSSQSQEAQNTEKDSKS